jgi:hypothetical protein
MTEPRNLDRSVDEIVVGDVEVYWALLGCQPEHFPPTRAIRRTAFRANLRS